MAEIYVAEVSAYDTVGATTVTLYFATQGFVTKPTDTPASTYYDGRLQQPANTQFSIFSGARTSGASTVGYGEVVLVNNDGGLDSYIDYAYDGRSIVIKLGVVTEASTTPTWTTLITGTIEQVDFSWDKMVIRIKDKQAKLNLPFQPTKFAGNNSLPNGLEGVAGDLLGKPKPRLYGTAYNFMPPLVNTSRLVYQISDGVVNSISAVYDKGNAVTTGTLRSYALMGLGSQSFTFTVNTGTEVVTTGSTNTYTTADPVTVTTSGTLPASTPQIAINTYYYWRTISGTTGTMHPTALDATNNTNIINFTGTGTGTHNIDNNVTIAGYYDWCLNASGSYIRLGTAATGQLTVDAVQGAAASNRTVAQILNSLLTSAGFSGGEISSGDVTALDTANSAEVGCWIGTEETTFLAVMDEIANSIGAWFGVNSAGVFQMGRITDPDSGTAVATLTDLEIMKIDRVASQDEGNGVPAWKVNLGYKKYYTVQTSDLAGAVSQATRAALAQEYRVTKDQDTAVSAIHLLSPEITFNTLLISSSDAATEATRRLGLYKVRRDRVECRVKRDELDLSTLELGNIIAVDIDRFGYSGGKNFMIIGIRSDFRVGMYDLTLWG